MTENRRTSRLPNFFKLDLADRHEVVADTVGLTAEERWMLKKETLSVKQAEVMVENLIGVFGMPLGLAVNFRLNNRDYLIPMAVEETSVVAAASNAAKMIRLDGELTAKAGPPEMMAQICLMDVPDLEQARSKLEAEKASLLETASKKDPTLRSKGGGVRDLFFRVVDTPKGSLGVVHLVVDVRDAMGANVVNTMAEAIAPVIATIAGGKVLCKIVTNLADRRLVKAQARVAPGSLATVEMDGPEVAGRIEWASRFAEADPYRAATHNKGIMNGVDAVLIASGNDWRAVEAGAHAYAAREGAYGALATWRAAEDGTLTGHLEMPMAVGTVGGIAGIHPGVAITRKILGVRNAGELAEVAAAVGLVQNLAALRALVTVGIQKGHMSLHARNMALSAGALGELALDVADQMIREGRIRFDRARELAKQFMKGKQKG
jgi:hydroxymethylglutaryl-CoA reductase